MFILVLIFVDINLVVEVQVSSFFELMKVVFLVTEVMQNFLEYLFFLFIIFVVEMYVFENCFFILIFCFYVFVGLGQWEFVEFGCLYSSKDRSVYMFQIYYYGQ